MWSYVSHYKQKKMDVLSFLDTAKELGVDGVEILDYFWDDKDHQLPRVKDKLETLELPVSAYAIGNNLTNPDAEERERQIQSIRDGVDMANLLETNRLRVFAGNLAEGVEYDAAFQWIVDGLAEASAYAEPQGVTLCLENHGLLAGSGQQVKQIIEAVGSTALKANPDTGNFMLVNENSVEAVRLLAPLSGSVHFKDFRQARPDETEHVYEGLNGARVVGTAIGEGDVDLPAVVQALQDGGYDGFLTIEYEGVEDPETALPRSVAYAQSVARGELIGNAPT